MGEGVEMCGRRLRSTGFFALSLRDRQEIPQVLFVFPSEKGGRGLRPAGNTKPEEKLEENRGG